MKVVLFCHAFTSCWNNGNAHFLRGVARELVAAGHRVCVVEPRDGWSRTNALRDGGADELGLAASLVPAVNIVQAAAELDLDALLDDVDLVLVHEWNPPALIAELGRRRVLGGGFTLLFHDTHHRAVTAPDELAAFDLDGYDGVLAFGEVLREIYLARGWARRAFTWHEAADTALYQPMPHVAKQRDLVWIGNWGDDERSAELSEFLIDPAAELGLSGRVYGVRYPETALGRLASAGLGYGGWLPNHRAPLAFAEARVTVHVPRRPYARRLRGIPTIRMFEALACGIPLVSAPWLDDEGLFSPGSYLQVSEGAAMKAALAALLADPKMAAAVARNGQRCVEERHTCRHRVAELLAIAESIHPLRPGRALPLTQRIA